MTQLPTSAPRRPEALLPWIVIGSIAVHAMCLGGAVWLSMRQPPRIEPPRKLVTAKLVRLGKPRDKRLLPRLEKAAPPPAPKVVEVPQPKTAPSPPSAKAAKSPATPKPKADVAKASAQRRQALSNAFAAFAKDSEDEPIGAEDGDLEGDSDSAEEGERYFGLILAKARRNYGITKTISPQELIRLKAVVILYIDEHGDLLKEPELQAPSGNALFDQEVLLALKKAAPFGPPPRELAEALRTVGIAIEATP